MGEKKSDKIIELINTRAERKVEKEIRNPLYSWNSILKRSPLFSVYVIREFGRFNSFLKMMNIIYNRERKVKREDEKLENHVGTKITLMDGKQRILKQDKKGFYVVKGGIRNYVEYHEHTGRYSMTGEWNHNN